MKKIAILCSGGDCQAMNACIKAVADTCDANGIELLGINRGYQGLIENDVRSLKKIDVANIETIAGLFIIFGGIIFHLNISKKLLKKSYSILS